MGTLTLTDIFSGIGGLGLLLYGMKMMSTGLEVVAGDRLQVILKHATSNRFLGIIVGIIATIVINSSTAVTIITVGFVNSGLMNLTQAIGVIMGVNVGTTFSAQLIAFRIDTIAPLFIFIGIVMHLFFKKRNIRNVGYVILGFGILLFSITIMTRPLRELSEDVAFQELLLIFENPWLAFLVGFVFTAIIQSSTATTAILVGMLMSGVPISITTTAFIILGTNVGTGITTVLASIPASRASKRAAIFHISYSAIGGIFFGTLILLFPVILRWFETTWTDSARQAAMFHTLFNVATLFWLLPFVPLLSKLMEKIIPVKGDEIDKKYERKLLYLDAGTAMQTPTLAVVNAHLEIVRMGEMALENLMLALESFFEIDEEKADKAIQNEKIINFLYHTITSKLVEINNMTLSTVDAERVGEMFGLVSDLERISDHAENIAEYTQLALAGNFKFSESATKELRTLSDLAIRIVKSALESYEKHDDSLHEQIDAMEEKVDELSETFVENHIKRLKIESCDPVSGVVFVDLITDLERSADHAINIATAAVPESKRK